MNKLLQLDNRKLTKQINVGGVPIGGLHPISIQTMTTTLTHDADATMRQIDRCVEAGVQIVRVAVPEERDAKALSTLVKRAPVPTATHSTRLTPMSPRYALTRATSGVRSESHKY